MAKIKRIFMTVQRGMTDKTAICVFPWEKPIVEEIHGGDAVVVTIDQLCNRDGVAKVQDVRKVVRLPTRVDLKGEPMVPAPGMTQREQLEYMSNVSDEDNPLHDITSEWNRLAEKYGMHNEVKLSNVEKVYGSLRNFRTCLRDFAAGRTPDFLLDADDDPIEQEEEKSLAEMSKAELVKACEAAGIDMPKKPTRDDLIALLEEKAA